MIEYPRPQITDKILRRPTPVHTVAMLATKGVVDSWVAMADLREEETERVLRALLAHWNCDTTSEALATIIYPAVWSGWVDSRDGCPTTRDEFTPAGRAKGCEEVCLAAGLVYCSLVGLIEPTGKHAAIIETHYRQGGCDHLKPIRHWPGVYTPFLQSANS